LVTLGNREIQNVMRCPLIPRALDDV
jgi:hypothetical protein